MYAPFMDLEKYIRMTEKPLGILRKLWYGRAVIGKQFIGKQVHV